MKKFQFGILAALAILLSARPAHAICINPPGNAGDQVYNTTYNVMQYCNGTNWISMGATNVWTLNGGDTYFNAGNVGIGTANPTEKLEVTGNIKATGTISDAAGVIGVPSGAVMHFDLANCPAGWSELTTGRGRYLVGKPSGGIHGATVGTALTDQENRPTGQHSHGASGLTFSGNALPAHSHTFSGGALPGHGHSGSTSSDGAHQHKMWDQQGGGATFGVDNHGGVGHAASGSGNFAWTNSNPNTGVAGAHTHSFSTNSVSAGTPSGTISSISAGTPSGSIGGNTENSSGAAGVAGTSAPYMQLLVCKKD